MKALPLRWWTQAQLAAVSRVLADPWGEWLRDWHGVVPDSITCVLAHEADQTGIEWRALAHAADEGTWWDLVATETGAVRTRLFGPETGVASASLAAALERKSHDALRQRLATALDLPETAADASAPPLQGSRWAGDVILRLSAPCASVRLFMNAACVTKVLGLSAVAPAIKLPPVEDGVSALRARASVELASFEISLGELQTLGLGDVLRLPHELGEPLFLKLEDTLLCTAHLGRHAHSRAVELLPAQAA